MLSKRADVLRSSFQAFSLSLDPTDNYIRRGQSLMSELGLILFNYVKFGLNSLKIVVDNIRMSRQMAGWKEEAVFDFIKRIVVQIIEVVLL